MTKNQPPIMAFSNAQTNYGQKLIWRIIILSLFLGYYDANTDIRKQVKTSAIGLIIASIVNWFLKSELMYWIVSYVGVAIFVGLTAYDTQKIKQLANACYMEDEETQNKVALMDAFTLYQDFINLFLYILRIFGKRK